VAIQMTARNPDREILAAARPCLATTGRSRCLQLVHHMLAKARHIPPITRHYGPSGNPAILVANGPTRTFNPTIRQSVIDRGL